MKKFFFVLLALLQISSVSVAADISFETFLKLKTSIQLPNNLPSVLVFQEGKLLGVRSLFKTPQEAKINEITTEKLSRYLKKDKKINDSFTLEFFGSLMSLQNDELKTLQSSQKKFQMIIIMAAFNDMMTDSKYRNVFDSRKNQLNELAAKHRDVEIMYLDLVN